MSLKTATAVAKGAVILVVVGCLVCSNIKPRHLMSLNVPGCTFKGYKYVNSKMSWFTILWLIILWHWHHQIDDTDTETFSWNSLNAALQLYKQTHMILLRHRGHWQHISTVNGLYINTQNINTQFSFSVFNKKHFFQGMNKVTVSVTVKLNPHSLTRLKNR